MNLIHNPGDTTPKVTSLEDIIKCHLKFHPGEVFERPKNLNPIGQIGYFLWIQIAGSMPIFTVSISLRIRKYCL